ncbi:MAG: T9SS type A sorting domain-containing protein [Melioribacteraceae bacterium]|nr:T9SS type A sorting domain-containing protein [Melioribacteraceae bacterium]MCF8263048.1 T9SS type A sorting domain-containing protein [Melioribacteraceae bacterium]
MKRLLIALLVYASGLIAQVTPVAKWQFDEMKGEKASDLIGENDAELEGPKWGEGYLNGSVFSNGYDDRISVEYEDDGALDLTEEGAIAMWFKIHSYTPYGGLIHKGEKKNWSDEAYSLQFWKSGKTLRAAITNDDGKQDVLDSETELEEDIWYHVVFTWNEEKMEIYLNGKLNAEKENEIGEVRKTKSDLQIASQLKQKFNNSYKYFGIKGAVDEVELYDKHLSSSDIESFLGSEPEEPKSGMVASWNFDENGGTEIADSVSGINGEILNGTAFWNVAISGTSLKFDGTDDQVRIPNNDLLNPTKEITVEAWVKWSVDPSDGNNYAEIVNKNGENQYQLHHSNKNEEFEFAVETDEGRKFVQSKTSPKKDVWYHVVGTYSASQEEMAIYVNGVRENYREQEGEIIQTDGDLFLAKHADWGRLFTGIIDEVTIYNILLSEKEINKRYLTLKPEEEEPKSDFFIHFKIDEGEGENITDAQKEYEGELKNSPKWIDGKINSALNFNGEDQWVYFPGTHDIPFEGKALTIAAWVNAKENKTSQIVEKGDWDGHQLGMGKWDGWFGSIYVGENKHTLHWKHGRPVLGEWYQLAVIYDGEYVRFYVNGELQDEEEASGNLKTNSREIAIASNNGSQKFFNGSIDDVKFIFKALTAEDLKSEYQGNEKKEVVWSAVETSGYESFIYSFDLDSEGNIYSGNWGGAGVYKSTDSGINWTNLVSDYWVWKVAVDDNDNIFVGTSSKGIIKSTDGGENWSEISISGAANEYRDILVDGNTIYAASWGSGIFKSTDGGETWESKNTGLTSNVFHSIAMAANGDIWTGSYDGMGLFKSTNGGENWESVEIPYKFIWSININDNGELFVGTYGGPADEGLGLYISTDNGKTWSFEEEFEGLNIFGVNFVSGITYVLTWENGIYTSNEDGVFSNEKMADRWISYNSGLMSGTVASIIVLEDGTVFLSTDDGIVYKSLDQITSISTGVSVNNPTELMLMQNYPNPFNPTTTIKFNIPVAVDHASPAGRYQSARTILRIYNALGEQVSELLNQELESGSYSVEFKASNLSSGIYFYKLSSGNFDQIRKMILMK